MDDEDDDLYDPSDSFPQHHDQNGHGQTDVPVNSLEAEEYNEEEEDDDDDFNIITEAPTDAVPGPAHPRHAALLNESQRSTSADSTAIAKSATPSAPVKFESASPALVQARPVASLKPGSDYPAMHMSTLDVNANPTHPTTGKSILSTDLDSDFPSEDDKPWRRPGQDITDYFNYGFDEFTWASYCLKQQELRKEVTDQKKQLDDMQSFLTMGMPGMPGAPPGGPAPSMPGAAPAGGGAPGGLQGMTGIPDMPPDMMQGMLASMMAQGLDPSSMDPMSFMQHAQAMMGGGQPGGGQQGQGYGGQGGNQQQMGYGGYNQQGGYSGGRGRGGGGRRW